MEPVCVCACVRITGWRCWKCWSLFIDHDAGIWSVLLKFYAVKSTVSWSMTLNLINTKYFSDNTVKFFCKDDKFSIILNLINFDAIPSKSQKMSLCTQNIIPFIETSRTHINFIYNNWKKTNKLVISLSIKQDNLTRWLKMKSSSINKNIVRD